MKCLKELLGPEKSAELINAFKDIGQSDGGIKGMKKVLACIFMPNENNKDDKKGQCILAKLSTNKFIIALMKVTWIKSTQQNEVMCIINGLNKSKKQNLMSCISKNVNGANTKTKSVSNILSYIKDILKASS